MTARLLLALLALLIPAAARAACQTISSGTVAFAATPSYDLRTAGAPTTSGAAGFSCNGSVITVLGGNYVRATVTSANAMRLTMGGDLIPYTVSADPGGTVTFTQGGTVDYMSPAVLSLLTILNGGTLSPKLYGQIAAGPNVAAGTYTDTLTVQWSWFICHGVNVLNVCILGESGTGTTTIQVSLVVANDCRVTAPSVNFGSAALVSQFTAVSPTLLVDCTKNTPYKIAFTTGGGPSATGGSSRPWRSMADGYGHSLQYNIYRPDGVTVWDEANPMPAAQAGTGALTPAQTQSYVAKINPSQAPQPVGHYTDTVSVVICF